MDLIYFHLFTFHSGVLLLISLSSCSPSIPVHSWHLHCPVPGVPQLCPLSPALGWVQDPEWEGQQGAGHCGQESAPGFCPLPTVFLAPCLAFLFHSIQSPKCALCAFCA